jgi:hypothetical protein
MKLDEMTTSVMLSYIQSQSYPDQYRLIGATILKNKIKLIYGVSNNIY